MQNAHEKRNGSTDCQIRGVLTTWRWIIEPSQDLKERGDLKEPVQPEE